MPTLEAETRTVTRDTPLSRAMYLLATGGPLFPLLVLLLGSCVHVLFGYSAQDLSGHAWGTDDAYISYRYVLNFLNGHGLVFNPGERVEGYSTFLYVLLLAGVSSVLGQALYTLSVGLNLACAVAVLLCFYYHIQTKFGRRNAVIAAYLLALCPPLWLAVASGLETPFVLFLQLAAWMAADRAVLSPRPTVLYGLCATLVLLVLARADGFVFVFITLVYLTVNGRLRLAVACGLVVAALSAPYLLWRHVYYGDFLPNTYYAKVAGTVSERVRYATKQLVSLAVSVGLLPYLMLTVASFSVALWHVRWPRETGGEIIPFEGVAAIGWIAYWLYIGGDALDARFLLILFALGISVFIRSLGYELETRAGAFLLAMVLALQLAPLGMDSRFRFTLHKYDRWKTLGSFLAEAHPRATLAVDAAGKIPYFSGLYTIDMLGLADTFVAHQNASFTVPGHSKFDAQYVLRRKPHLIAAFVDPRMNLAWGLSRERYEAAGYRLRYLVNMQKLSMREYGQTDIVDASMLTERKIFRLIDSGYGYAVLERAGPAERG